ncbi:unnamed protein product, partial [Meganyctiphanes norvegica]
MGSMDVKDLFAPGNLTMDNGSLRQDVTETAMGPNPGYQVADIFVSVLRFRKLTESPLVRTGVVAVYQKCDVTSGVSSKSASTIPQPKKPPLSFVGKRRGGRILATGMVKKPRKETDNNKSENSSNSSSNSNSGGGSGKTDAWSQYMNEVKKYREQSCEEEDKRRPLIKL